MARGGRRTSFPSVEEEEEHEAFRRQRKKRLPVRRERRKEAFRSMKRNINLLEDRRGSGSFSGMKDGEYEAVLGWGWRRMNVFRIKRRQILI